jgi:hypothetical protein
MSGLGISYPPPTENVPIFDATNFRLDTTPLTATSGLKYFLSYPFAQGTETLQTTNVEGLLTCDNNLVVNKTNMIMNPNATPPTNYIQFPDGSKQYVASTGLSPITPSPAGTYTNLNATINQYGQITTASSNTSGSTISIKAFSPLYSGAIATFQYFSAPANTDWIDIYTMGGGGRSGGFGRNNGGSPVTAGGGGGGSGGCSVVSRYSFGESLNNVLYCLIQPQFVCDFDGVNTYTPKWTGTFTQSGTNITIVSTTTGAIAIGDIIYLTQTNFNTAYPTGYNNGFPFGNFFNQLQIVSGAGTSWVVQSQQSQTLSTAITANSYTPNVLWSGTFTQSGTTITAVSTTTGTFGYPNNGCYLVATGTSCNTQYIISQTDANNCVVNSSQNIGTAYAGRILYTPIGANVYTAFNQYAGNLGVPYTGFPSIAFATGGLNGTNGQVPSVNPVGGSGGAGGSVIAYLPYCNQLNAGAKGATGAGTNDPTGMTNVSTAGGYTQMLWNKYLQITNNGITTNTLLLNTFTYGGSNATNNNTYRNIYYGGVGGAIVVFNSN